MAPRLPKNRLELAYKHLCDQGLCSDKGTTHSYIEVYEELFAPLRTKGASVLEIGVEHGHSLALWRDYFLGASHVWGLDRQVPQVIPEGVTFVLHESTDPAMPRYLDPKGYDLVVDDSSHVPADQAQTFSILRPSMRKDSIYVIEDLQSDDAVGYVQAQTGADWEIIDRRGIKGRYDDVLMVWRP